MIAKGLKGMAMMEDRQVTMNQMTMKTMEIVEMMTPQVVMAIPYQVAVTPSIHRPTLSQGLSCPISITSH